MQSVRSSDTKLARVLGHERDGQYMVIKWLSVKEDYSEHTEIGHI